MRTTEGGSGGVVICLGVGGMVDLEEMLGLDGDESEGGGPGEVEVWLLDSRRPWNLTNIFGGPVIHDPDTGEVVRKIPGVDKGKILPNYRSGKGGIVVFDDGDVEEDLQREREAYCALEEMPEIGEEDEDDEDVESDNPDIEHDDIPISGQGPRKRKSWGDEDETDDDFDSDRPRQRRRSNEVRFIKL